MKPFYVHRHGRPGKVSSRFARGFTVYVEENPINSHEVNVGVAFCSPKDQFCKRIGREYAKSAEIKTINKRKLPKMLAAVATVAGDALTSEKNWEYLYKFML